MTIEGFAGTYEIDDSLAQYLPLIVRDEPFIQELAKEGIILQPGETVTDFIRRHGFPYSIRDPEERNDN